LFGKSNNIVNGRGVYCLSTGGVQIDETLALAALTALEPTKLDAGER